jgi:hypothetical protein
MEGKEEVQTWVNESFHDFVQTHVDIEWQWTQNLSVILVEDGEEGDAIILENRVLVSCYFIAS